jgi:general secretion pathway protein G
MKRLQQRPLNTRRSAFTLLELLIVLGIIVALAAMVAPNLIGSAQDAKIQTTRATIRTIEDAFKRKAVKMNGFDTNGSIASLKDTYEDSLGKEQVPLLEETPRDEWNNEFQYKYEAGMVKPTIWSFGPDGEDNGGDSGDDISNLPREEE